MSKKLKILFFLGFFLLIAHGLEEYFNGFYNLDASFEYLFAPFIALPSAQGMFLLFQISLWLIFLVFGLAIIGPKWRLWMMTIPATILILEASHIVEAFAIGGYYPGLITAIFLPIIGILIWKELYINYQSKKAILSKQ